MTGEFSDLPDIELEPMDNMQHRAEQADRLLEDFHVARTNLSLRNAMHNRSVQKWGHTNPVTAKTRDALAEAQTELDQIKYALYELMGVDV